MDTKDVSDDNYFAAIMAAAKRGAETANRKKGQLVRNHPPRAVTISRFMAHLEQSTASIAPNQTSFTTSQVPSPYPPCTLPLQELQPLVISDMRLETHHRGRKVFLHAVTPPCHTNTMMVIVEDEQGTTVVLQLYHQPDEAVVPAREAMRSGVCIVKEPFFKCAMDGTYALRADHVSDVLWLDDSDDRIPQKWRRPASIWGAGIAGSEGIRKKGNDAVKNEKWAAAERLYSYAIQIAETPEEEQLARLNRSLANLRLERPEKALSDATSGGDTGPSEKGLFREARALYDLGHYQTSLEKLQELLGLNPQNIPAAAEAERTKARLQEQKSGQYDFRLVYKQAEKTPPLIDCATFSAPVEVREAPGKGRGLFTTVPVSAGQLLLCEKAFGYGHGSRLSVLMNINTMTASSGGHVQLWSQVVQKLYQGHGQAHEFRELHCGDYTPITISEVDEVPVVDTFLEERVMKFNGFGAPRTSHASFVEARSGKVIGEDSEMHTYSSTGIWLLASRINHSCIGNCRRSFIGDMQILRATADMPAGTELLFPYRQLGPLESHADVQKGLKPWGFSCDCELCKDKKATPKAVLAKRKALRRVLEKEPGPHISGNISKAFAAIEKMEKTFPATNGSSIRMELWEPCLALAYALRSVGKLTDAAKMAVKGLENLGFTITARPPTGKNGPTPRLEVERWGMASEMTPDAFLLLAEACEEFAPELCGRAKRYAEIAYSMVVGESETIGDVFPDFA